MKILESAGFSSISSAKNIQYIKVLSLGDEFRKVMAVGVSQEKFRKGLEYGLRDHQFRRPNAGPNGSQPGSEGAPNQFRVARCQIVKQSLRNNTGKHKDMISIEFAFDGMSVDC